MGSLIFPFAIKIGGILQSSRLLELHAFLGSDPTGDDPEDILGVLVNSCFRHNIEIRVDETGIYPSWTTIDISTIRKVTRCIDALYMLHVRNRVMQYIEHQRARQADFSPLLERLLNGEHELAGERALFRLRTYKRIM